MKLPAPGFLTAFVLDRGPFDGLTMVLPLQPAAMSVYLIRDLRDLSVHAYEWADRTESRDGEVIGWVLRHLVKVAAVSIPIKNLTITSMNGVPCSIPVPEVRAEQVKAPEQEEERTEVRGPGEEPEKR